MLYLLYLSFIYSSIIVFSQNFYDLTTYENNKASQNCACFSNSDGSNIFFINYTQVTPTIIYPINNASSCFSNTSSCISCIWKVYKDYKYPLDALVIVLQGRSSQIEYTLEITNCYESLLSFNNINSSGYFVAQERELCIYFNSTTKNNNCNYNDCGLEILLDFYDNFCECGRSEIGLNFANPRITLTNSPCFNVICNCEWHINVEEYDEEYNMIAVQYGQQSENNNSILLMTNCKNNFSIINSSNDQIFSKLNFYTQENEICIKLSTHSNEHMCSYSPTSVNYFLFEISVGYLCPSCTIIEVNITCKNTMYKQKT